MPKADVRGRGFYFPDEALPRSVALVALAVVADRYPTYGSIMRRTRLSRQTVHAALHRLRDLELVTFDRGKTGTIRPLFAACEVRAPEDPEA